MFKLVAVQILLKKGTLLDLGCLVLLVLSHKLQEQKFRRYLRLFEATVFRSTIVHTDPVRRSEGDLSR